jgi:hypothetical protein
MRYLAADIRNLVHETSSYHLQPVVFSTLGEEMKLREWADQQEPAGHGKVQ